MSVEKNDDDIKVTIVCTVYNHEHYLRQCLDGFILQKTNFFFEAIVHDDASTDGSANIIKEYAEKYPNIIKPIYQIKNQYSQQIEIIREIIIPKAKGKFIAICEGDDYWIDENKLQMQYNYMEFNPNCTFCFTNANVLDLNSNKVSVFLNNDISCNDNLNIEEFLNCFKFIPTCTFFLPKNNYEKFPTQFDEFCPGGDRKLSLFSILIGQGHFINIITSVYRKNVPNSAMYKWKHLNNEQNYFIAKCFLNLYKNINNLSNYLYDKALKKEEKISMLDMILSNYDNKLLNDKEFKDAFNTSPFKIKLKFYIIKFFPKLLNFYKKHKDIKCKKKS